MAAVLVASAASAQDEHSRRLAAEFTVMAGDARRLAGPAEAPLHREGLRARLAGALVGLPILMRQAGGADAGGVVGELRVSVAREDWSGFGKLLAILRQRHPLDLSHILPATPTPGRLRVGRVIHEQACAGCHDAPSEVSSLPAFNLFKQIRTMPHDEFAARLLIGVRGDTSTAHRNPFSDLEIGALIAYYASGGKE